MGTQFGLELRRGDRTGRAWTAVVWRHQIGRHWRSAHWPPRRTERCGLAAATGGGLRQLDPARRSADIRGRAGSGQRFGSAPHGGSRGRCGPRRARDYSAVDSYSAKAGNGDSSRCFPAGTSAGRRIPHDHGGSRGRIWACGDGVWRVIPMAEWTRFTTKDGLKDNMVAQVAEDADGSSGSAIATLTV